MIVVVPPAGELELNRESVARSRSRRSSGAGLTVGGIGASGQTCCGQLDHATQSGNAIHTRSVADRRFRGVENGRHAVHIDEELGKTVLECHRPSSAEEFTDQSRHPLERCLQIRRGVYSGELPVAQEQALAIFGDEAQYRVSIGTAGDVVQLLDIGADRQTVEERWMSHDFDEIAGDGTIYVVGKCVKGNRGIDALGAEECVVHEVPDEHLVPFSATSIEYVGGVAPNLDQGQVATISDSKRYS